MVSQENLMFDYFKQNPNRDIPHAEAVDFVTKDYLEKTGKVFRDPDRAIRKLAQSGSLIKISKGVYRYDPDFIEHRDLEDFSAKDKKTILARDGYKCVICGADKASGVELHVDHIKPKEFGGKATLTNGQTLCAQHNFQKKTYKQTETGKKMFIRLLELAKQNDDKKTADFCRDALKIYDKHGINGHIEWEE